MNKEQAVTYLKFSGFSEEQIKTIEGAFSGWGKVCPSAGVDCEDCPAYEKKSEWQRDHEILKAYSDGANEVLDKIREEIKTLSNANPSYWHSGDMVEREEVFEIIDKYQSEIPTGSEGSEKE